MARRAPLALALLLALSACAEGPGAGRGASYRADGLAGSVQQAARAAIAPGCDTSHARCMDAAAWARLPLAPDNRQDRHITCREERRARETYAYLCVYKSAQGTIPERGRFGFRQLRTPSGPLMLFASAT